MRQEHKVSESNSASKNTMLGTSRNIRKVSLVGGLVGILLLTSSCSGNVDSSEKTSTAVSTAVSTVAPTTTPTITPDESALAGSIINGVPTKKELGKNVKGEYIQTTIAQNDPAFTYNQAIVEETAFKYMPEEITAVQKQIMNFIAEETIGSTLNDSYDPKDIEAWWGKNKDKFAAKNQDEIFNALATNDNTRLVVFQSLNRVNKYDLVYGKDVTHVTSQKISLNKIIGGEIDGKNAIKFFVDVSFDLAANIDGKVQNESTTGSVNYTLVKESNGQWLISGYTNTFATHPLK